MKERSPIQFEKMSFFILTIVIAKLPFFSFDKKLRRQRIEELNYTCQHCGRSFSEDELTPHHLLPKQMGGNNTLDNMYITCPDCHNHVDDKVIRKGKLPNGVRVEEIDSDYPELIGNEDKYGKAKRRFSKKRRRRW